MTVPIYVMMAVLCANVAGPRLIVATTPLSATREAARVYLHSVDMGIGGPLPGPEALPGKSVVGPLLLTGDGHDALLSTGPAHRSGDPESYYAECALSVYRVAPFQEEATIAFAAGWSQFAACTFNGGVITLATKPDDEGVLHGRIEAYPWEAEGHRLGAHPKGWAPPGAPVAAIWLKETQRLAVLCRGADGTGSIIAIIVPSVEGAPLKTLELADEESLFGAAPSGLAATPDERYLFALTSGYGRDRSSGEASSWLHVVDATGFKEPYRPVQVPGTAQPEDAPLHASGDRFCWAATRTPGSDFAFVTGVRATDTEMRTEVKTPLTGVSSPLRLAPDPAGHALAVGIENRLEIWADGRRSDPIEFYEAPVRALEWTAEGLFLGEAGRVRLVDPQQSGTVRIVQLRSGWVTSIALAPRESLPGPDADGDGLTDEEEKRLGTSPDLPDTDGDGIPDGSDPEPITPSPRLMIPRTVIFHGETVGQEIKAFRVNPRYGEHSAWEVSFDRAEMPWLVLHPRQGTGPDVVYMGVDPGRFRYTPGEVTSGKLTVRMAGTQPDTMAAGSPATVEIRILPEQRSRVRRILWIWDEAHATESFRNEADRHRLRAVAELLAAPPLLFTHREGIAPFQEPLDSYAILVLNAAAAVQGALTRQALLDFVIGGGALLFLGEFMPGQTASELTQWLSPIGVQIDAGVRVDGLFPSAYAEGLCRHWPNTPIDNGCAVYADDPAAVLVHAAPGSEQAIFLARTYGHGRIAVLASASPLETSALRTQEDRLFAENLFRWLAQAATDVQEQDMDGDGLPDSVEDRNGNGIVDPGETDYLNPDTDGDGIPDGMEDVNLNGRVDDGETSPLNPDSNGNGIFDGADPSPLPQVAAPVIARVDHGSLKTTPAEGGYLVTILGRNFAPDAIVRFGDRPARIIRVLPPIGAVIQVPPCSDPAGGDVSVRVINASSDLEGVLLNGFHYDPRSKVDLALHAAQPVEAQDHRYSGAVSLHVQPPADVNLDKILLLLRPDPREGFQWGEPPTASIADAIHHPVLFRQTGSGDLYVILLGAKSTIAGPEDIGPIPWEFTPSGHPPAALRISIEEAHVFTVNGQTIDTSAAPLDLALAP